MEKRDIETAATRTDTELLRAYVRGASEEAFKYIVERHQSMVYGTCLRMLSDTEAASDATQATFFVLARKANRLSSRVSLAGWLYLTAKRTAFHMIRAKRRRSQHETEASALKDRVVQHDSDELVRADLSRELDAALAALSCSQRQIVILRYLEGRSQAETAAELGLKEHSVSATLSRALQRMREKLDRKGVKVSSAVLLAFLMNSTSPQLPDGLNATLNTLATGAGKASATALEVGQVILQPTFTFKLILAMVCLSFTVSAGWIASPYFISTDSVAKVTEEVPVVTTDPEDSTSVAIPRLDDSPPIKTKAKPGSVYSDRFDGDQLNSFWERVSPERIRTFGNLVEANPGRSRLRMTFSGSGDPKGTDPSRLKAFEMVSKPVALGEGVLAIQMMADTFFLGQAPFECGIEILAMDGRSICKIVNRIKKGQRPEMVVGMEGQPQLQALPRPFRMLGLFLDRKGEIRLLPKYLKPQKWPGGEIDRVRVRLFAKTSDPKSNFKWVVSRMNITRFTAWSETPVK